MASIGLMLWLVVGFCGLLLLTICFGVFYFVIRRQTIIRIFMPDKSIFSKRYFKSLETDNINLGNTLGTYIIDGVTFFKTFFGIAYHYTWGNPNPLHIDPTADIPKQVGHRAQDLSRIHDNKLLKDLFTVENLDQIIMYLVIATLLVSSIVLIWNIIPQQSSPVLLSSSQNNTQIIKDACKLAIKGL
jgi:hypothetical protein